MSITPRSLILVLIAVIAAGGTAMMARNWLNIERAQTVQVAPTVKETTNKVLVASENLATGHIIKQEDLRWQPWPEDGVLDLYVVEGVGSATDYAGSVVRRGIAAGTPVTLDQIVKSGERGFLAAVLPPGMRAVSVPISATSGISGFVFPGDRVDLILTHKIKTDGGARHASETVLTNVRVLAVDQDTNDQENAPRIAKTATLEVTPKQVEKIAVLRQLGALSLSLRSLARADQDSDDSATELALPVSGRTHTWDSDVSRLLPPVNAEGQYLQVTVARGSKISSLKFGVAGK